MKLFKVGDTRKAPCEKCRTFENATFKLRDVPLSDNSAIVENALVGVCNRCDSVIFLPQQEAHLVKTAIAKAKLTKI